VVIEAERGEGNENLHDKKRHPKPCPSGKILSKEMRKGRYPRKKALTRGVVRLGLWDRSTQGDRAGESEKVCPSQKEPVSLKEGV